MLAEPPVPAAAVHDLPSALRVDDCQALLEEAAALVERCRSAEAFRRFLGAPLSALWTEARSTGRAEKVREVVRAHRLGAIVQQDPFTRRAASKPRGYAGDAVMMDQAATWSSSWTGT